MRPLALFVLFLTKTIYSKPQDSLPTQNEGGLVSITGLNQEMALENTTVQIRWLNEDTMSIVASNMTNDLIFLTPKSNFVPAPKNGCTFTGKFQKDLMAEASVAGCQHSDETVIVISNSEHIAQYILQNGSTQRVVPTTQSRFKRQSDGDDYLDYDYKEDLSSNDYLETGEEFSMRSAAITGPPPDEITINLSLGYDVSYLRYRGTEDEAISFINQVVELAKSHFRHKSLSIKVNLRIKHGVQKLSFSTKAQDLCTKITSDLNSLIERRRGNNVPLIIFTQDCALGKKVAVTGCSFNGAACGVYNGKNLAIVDLTYCKKQSWLLIQTINTLVHEIGHLLGMKHDFAPEHGSRDCDGKGFMSYGKNLPEKWSRCSDSNMVKWYNEKGYACDETCEETKESIRLWAHSGASLQGSIDDCSLNCKNDPECFASTWDPTFKLNSEFNCWQFPFNYTQATEEDGFTSSFCKPKPSSCREPQEKTRLWSHYDESFDKGSLEECSRSCLIDPECHAVTMFANYCWKFSFTYSQTTYEDGFTTVFC